MRLCGSLMRELAFVGVGLIGACAFKGDVRRVELQVGALREDVDSLEAARKAAVDSVFVLTVALQQALATEQTYLVRMRGDILTNVLAVEQQVLAAQELTGQSEQRLTQLRQSIEARAQDLSDASASAGPAEPKSGVPGPAQMFTLSLDELRRGSIATARLGFREFLSTYPTDERAADALYYVGESFEPENADSATAAYLAVVATYPRAPSVASALYKLGLLAEDRGDKTGARTYYQRVITGFPRSDEANLATARLRHLER